MQKTKIEYYCDACGRKIKKVMFTFEYRARFYSAKGEKFEENSGHYVDTKHYCMECATDIIDVFGLHMYRTQALLDAENNDYFTTIPVEEVPNA